jgi:hypothetical protein
MKGEKRFFDRMNRMTGFSGRAWAAGPAVFVGLKAQPIIAYGNAIGTVA